MFYAYSVYIYYLADTVEMEKYIYVFRCLLKMSHKQGLVIMQNKMYFKLNCVCLPKDKHKKIYFQNVYFFINNMVFLAF